MSMSVGLPASAYTYPDYRLASTWAHEQSSSLALGFKEKTTTNLVNTVHKLGSEEEGPNDRVLSVQRHLLGG